MARSFVSHGIASIAIAMIAASALAGGGGGGGGGTPLNPFTAPPDAMDTLNSGSASGGLDAGRILGGVKQDLFGGGGGNPGGGPADPFNQNPGGSPFGTPAGGATGSPFGAPPADLGGTTGSPFGGPPAGLGGPAGPGAASRSSTAIGGMRIISRLSNEVLQDARSAKVISTDGYYDDGQTAGDLQANDGVFTNIVIDNEYISPGEFLIKSRALNGLRTLENFSPQEFFNVRVATTEPVSSLPKVTDLEEQQDTRLRQFNDRFLRDFRKEPDNPGSPLLKAFIPAYPKAPNLPLPATFSPRARPNEQVSNAAGRDGEPGTAKVLFDKAMDDDVTGTPIGGASSRYF